MAGEVTYQPTERDYIAAAQASFTVQVRRRRVLRNWAVIATALAVLAAIVAWRNPYWQQDPFGVLFLIGWGIFGYPLMIAVAYLFVPFRARRLFKQQKTARQPITWRWSDEAISYDRDSAQGRQNWADLYGWAKRGGTFLFFVNEIVALPLPLRVLTAAQIDDLEQLLVAHAPRRR